jgi:hypothetical protein
MCTLYAEILTCREEVGLSVLPPFIDEDEYVFVRICINLMRWLYIFISGDNDLHFSTDLHVRTIQPIMGYSQLQLNFDRYPFI